MMLLRNYIFATYTNVFDEDQLSKNNSMKNVTPTTRRRRRRTKEKQQKLVSIMTRKTSDLRIKEPARGESKIMNVMPITPQGS